MSSRVLQTTFAVDLVIIVGALAIVGLSVAKDAYDLPFWLGLAGLLIGVVCLVRDIQKMISHKAPLI